MVEMPAIIVIISCLATPIPSTDENDKYTGHEATEWVYQDSKKVCRREEIPLMDGAAAKGADAQPFNQWRCNQTGMKMATDFDVHQRMKGGKYRFWRYMCPVPKVDEKTHEVTAWFIPDDCGDRATIKCETDTEI
jgi:hypothetical protein